MYIVDPSTTTEPLIIFPSKSSFPILTIERSLCLFIPVDESSKSSIQIFDDMWFDKKLSLEIRVCYSELTNEHNADMLDEIVVEMSSTYRLFVASDKSVGSDRFFICWP